MMKKLSALLLIVVMLLSMATLADVADQAGWPNTEHVRPAAHTINKVGSQNGAMPTTAPAPTAEPIEPVPVITAAPVAPTAAPVPEPTAEPIDIPVVAEPVFAASPEDFAGEWIAVTLEAEGELMPVSGQAQTWQVLFGSEDNTIAIDGTNVSYFGGEAEAFAFEDGCLQIVMPHLPGVPDGMLDKRVELRADGTISFSTMNMTIYCERAPMDLSGYEGEWHAVYIDTPIMKGNPKQMWGLDISLTLNEDGTGMLNYITPDEGMRWFERDRAVWYGDEDAATPLALDGEGFLYYGVEASGMIVFARDAEARWSGDLSPVISAAPTAEPTPEPTPEPTAEPVPTAVPTAAPTALPTAAPVAPARPNATPTPEPAPAPVAASTPEVGAR